MAPRDLATERWRRARRTVLELANHTCSTCGGHADSVDHIIPRSRGGGHELANLRAMCRRCNGKRGNGGDTPTTSRVW